MAKENVGDKIVDRLIDRRNKVRAILAKQYKGVEPFRAEPVPDKEMLEYYDMLSPEDMSYLVERHGEDTMNQFIYEMEMKRYGR